MKKCYSKAWLAVFENDNDALIPEVWAQESLMVLEANMVAANLVHRDFEDEIAAYGDVVNAHRPNTFVAKRKTDADEVTVQDAESVNVPVKLDQHIHVSFTIKDGEESKSFKDLVNLYLTPALVAEAQAIDEVVCGQVYEFMGNSVGKLGTDPTRSTVIAAKELMTNNKVPLVGRNMLVSPNAEGSLLDIGEFIKANELGDDGSAMREGNLGRKFGFDFFTGQNVASVAAGSTVTSGAVNLTAGYASGTTAITMDGFSAAIVAGSWCTVAGDMTPQMITGTTGAGTPTAMVIAPGLNSAVLNDAVITVYTPGDVNLTAGYAAGYAKDIATTLFAIAPKTGQLASFGVTAARYSALSTPTITALLLNRPLDVAVADADVVGLGPAGDYNFAFHRNAVALVTRPLAQPRSGTGALSAVANYNGLSIRVTITYEGRKQGHLVTVDMLAGVKTLDARLGCVMYT
jgi:hypothetical protein